MAEQDLLGPVRLRIARRDFGAQRLDEKGEQRICPAIALAADHRADIAHLRDHIRIERRREICGAQLQEIGIIRVVADADDVEGGEHAHIHHRARDRSEEHTSELQSLMRNSYAVIRFTKQKLFLYNKTTYQYHL